MMRRLLPAGVAAAIAVSMPASAPPARADGGRPEAFQSEGSAAAGVLSPPRGRTTGRAPAVLVLLDAFGPDRRADPYVDSLTAAGVLVLEVDLFAMAERSGRGTSPVGLAAAIATVVGELALDPRVDPRRIGILGFGAGGRAALMVPPAAGGTDPIAARAVLYPGCAGLERDLPRGEIGVAAGSSPVLLVHGDIDAANPATACIRMANVLSGWVHTDRVEVAGAGYAWDRPAFAAEGPSLLPRPDGAGRVRSTPRPDLAEEIATRVAAWLALALWAGEGAAHGR